MTEPTPSKPLRGRSLTSLILGPCFLLVALSGLLMYLWSPSMPPSVLGLARGQWKELHTVLSFASLAAALVHILYNGRAILGYLAAPFRARRRVTREALLSAAILAAIVAGTVLRVPPFSLIAGSGGHHGPPPGAASGQPGPNVR